MAVEILLSKQKEVLFLATFKGSSQYQRDFTKEEYAS